MFMLVYVLMVMPMLILVQLLALQSDAQLSRNQSISLAATIETLHTDTATLKV
jgi:hypothetical protein